MNFLRDALLVAAGDPNHQPTLPACSLSAPPLRFLWAEWLRKELLVPVAHRHVVLTIPRLLRELFRRRRELLTHFAQAGGDALSKLLRGCGGEEARPGFLVSVATAGTSCTGTRTRTSSRLTAHWVPMDASIPRARPFPRPGHSRALIRLARFGRVVQPQVREPLETAVDGNECRLVVESQSRKVGVVHLATSKLQLQAEAGEDVVVLEAGRDPDRRRLISQGREKSERIFRSSRCLPKRR